MKAPAGTPTVIRHLDTGKEIGIVVTVWGMGTFSAEFQVYERFTYDPEKHYPEEQRTTIGNFKSTSGQYSDEREAVKKFDEWANEQQEQKGAA